MLEWIIANPNSNLYPRQLPIAGLDSKWLEGRKGLLPDLVATIKGEVDERDFFQVCGLKPLPHLIRMRILDQVLSKQLGGLTDILAPWEELAYLDLSVTKVFVVENLQTGLAFPDIPGALVFMRLGYNVDVLARLPWIAKAKCIYWGDLDTVASSSYQYSSVLKFLDALRTAVHPSGMPLDAHSDFAAPAVAGVLLEQHRA